MFFFVALLLVFGVVFVTLFPLSRPVLRGQTPEKKLRRQRQWVSLALLFVIPAATFLAYRFLGNPNLADQPYAQRAALDKSNIARFISSVETHLAAHGDDARGWLVLAEVLQGQGENKKAITAYRKADALQPSETAQLGLATSLIADPSPENLSEASRLVQNIKQTPANQIQIRIQMARLKTLQDAPLQGGSELRQLYDALPDNDPQRFQILELLQKLPAVEARTKS